MLSFHRSSHSADVLTLLRFSGFSGFSGVAAAEWDLLVLCVPLALLALEEEEEEEEGAGGGVRAR